MYRQLIKAYGNIFKVLFFVVLYQLPLLCFSQGEFNQWRFGLHAGLNFNFLPPSAVSGSVLNAIHVTITQSDSLGNLLFYSDGQTIWNKNNIVMPNGSGLYGGYSKQSVFLIPDPGKQTQYFLFTVGPWGVFPNMQGLFYSKIDMTLAGGLGGVIPGMKNVFVPGTENIPNGIHGTRHRNNADIWLTVRSLSPQVYLSYLVTASGLVTTPVVSPSLVNYTYPPGSGPNIRFKISQDGIKMVTNYPPDTLVEICHFDNLTGIVSPLFKIPVIYRGVKYNTQSAEFSKNSIYLYLSVVYNGISPPDYPQSLVCQYNATFSDSTQFVQSQIFVDSTTSSGGYFQLGPDDKIYFSKNGPDSIGLINYPNIQGSGCNFQSNAIFLNGGQSTAALPQFLQRYKAYIHHTEGCPDEPILFSSDIWPPQDSIRWNFGDPASGSANIATVANPVHNYSLPGNYIVELYVRHNDNRRDTTWQTITIQPAPQPALGPDQTICAPQTATFDAGTCTGCTYQWDDLTTMTMNIGSGQTYTTGTPGLYRVNVTGPNGCIGRDTVQLSIGTPVAVSVTIATGSTTVCAGTQVTFTSNATNAGSPPGYQWKVNAVNASNANNATFTYTPVNGDCVTLEVTSNGACVTGSPATSNQVCMTVNPLHLVSLTITSTSTHTCAGMPVTFNAFPTNPGNSPVYLWKVNGVNAGSNNQIFTYTPVNGDCITCELTSDISCPTGNPALSNTICMIVDQPLLVNITVSTPLTTVCAGTSVTFTAYPTNGGSLPSYQWKVNNVNIAGSTNSTYTYTPLNGDLVTCQLTSSDNCVTGNPAISPSVTMTVTPNPAVTVSVTPSANPFCTGSQVTFIAVPNHGGLLPVYLWKVNGSSAGTNSSSFTYTPMNGDIVTCELTSSDNCVTGNPATSAPITMTASPILTVSITIAASSNPFCAGSQVTFTATPDHGGLIPGYQWKVNGGNTGTSSPSFTYAPANGDQVSCILNSSASCITGNPALSNIITMTVNTNLPAGVSISTLTNPFCPGTSVTITAAPTNGGLLPVYQWKLNGVNAGTNLPTFTFYPAAGDSVRCVMTSNLNCVTGNPASSAKIIMSERAAPNVTFQSCFDSITTVNAKPYRLKGGLPLGGQYSGPGVNSITGIFTPSVAGIGLKTIEYSYTNIYTCLATKSKTILVQPIPSFTCGNALTDIRDNHIYPTVQIGTQCWMAKNLNYGNQISPSQIQYDNCVDEKYCYNDDPSNCTDNGGLYQWDEMMKYDNTPAGQGICPPGWHIPTENDWTILFNFYLGNGQAGKPLQDTLITGFKALTSGVFYLNSSWNFNGFASLFWSSSSLNATKGISHGLNNYNFSVSLYPASRANAFPVRCLHD